MASREERSHLVSIVLLGLCAALSACGSPASGTDSGSTAGPDAKTSGPVDGAVVPADAGTTDEDTGVVPAGQDAATTATADVGTPPGKDAGIAPDAGGASPDSGLPAIYVAICPKTDTILPNEQIHFSATVVGIAPTTVTWLASSCPSRSRRAKTSTQRPTARSERVPGLTVVMRTPESSFTRTGAAASAPRSVRVAKSNDCAATSTRETVPRNGSGRDSGLPPRRETAAVGAAARAGSGRTASRSRSQRDGRMGARTSACWDDPRLDWFRQRAQFTWACWWYSSSIAMKLSYLVP